MRDVGSVVYPAGHQSDVAAIQTGNRHHQSHQGDGREISTASSHSCPGPDFNIDNMDHCIGKFGLHLMSWLHLTMTRFTKSEFPPKIFLNTDIYVRSLMVCLGATLNSSHSNSQQKCVLFAGNYFPIQIYNIYTCTTLFITSITWLEIKSEFSGLTCSRHSWLDLGTGRLHAWLFIVNIQLYLDSLPYILSTELYG